MTLDSQKKKKKNLYFSLDIKCNIFLISYLTCLNNSHKQSYK